MIHELKTDPQYWEYVATGFKCFEVRKDDRPFAEDDVLFLREYVREERNGRRGYTGRSLFARVGFVLREPNFVKEGYCIMALTGVFVVSWKRHPEGRSDRPLSFSEDEGVVE